MWFDAHNHLQDPRLETLKHSWLPRFEKLPPARAVLNDTSESDWPRVAELAALHPWVLPSFGLHPWHVGSESQDWLNSLRKQLLAHPRSGVGEVGLDRWIQPHDMPAQIRALEPQIRLAAELRRPLTLHCLRAWGTLREILAHLPLPPQGFLLHSYGGPAEMIPEFVRLGAYFSFSPAFLADRKTVQREAFRRIPVDRLLAETDAPDMAPPPDQNPFPLEAQEGHPLNDPSNIQTAYLGLAQTLGLSPSDLSRHIESNFTRLFGR